MKRGKKKELLKNRKVTRKEYNRKGNRERRVFKHESKGRKERKNKIKKEKKGKRKKEIKDNGKIGPMK